MRARGRFEGRLVVHVSAEDGFVDLKMTSSAGSNGLQLMRFRKSSISNCSNLSSSCPSVHLEARDCSEASIFT